MGFKKNTPGGCCCQGIYISAKAYEDPHGHETVKGICRVDYNYSGTQNMTATVNETDFSSYPNDVWSTIDGIIPGFLFFVIGRDSIYYSDFHGGWGKASQSAATTSWGFQALETHAFGTYDLNANISRGDHGMLTRYAIDTSSAFDIRSLAEFWWYDSDGTALCRQNSDSRVFENTLGTGTEARIYIARYSTFACMIEWRLVGTDLEFSCRVGDIAILSGDGTGGDPFVIGIASPQSVFSQTVTVAAFTNGAGEAHVARQEDGTEHWIVAIRWNDGAAQGRFIQKTPGVDRTENWSHTLIGALADSHDDGLFLCVRDSAIADYDFQFFMDGVEQHSFSTSTNITARLADTPPMVHSDRLYADPYWVQFYGGLGLTADETFYMDFSATTGTSLEFWTRPIGDVLLNIEDGI